MTFDDLRSPFEEHLRGLRRTPSYIKNIRQAIRSLACYCQEEHGLMDPRQLAERHLVGYIKWLQGRLGPKTIYAYQRMLRTWAAWATLRGHLLWNPFKDFTFKHPPLLPQAVHTVEQMQALIAAPPSDTLMGRRDRVLLEFLYGTGMRGAEVVGVDLEHLFLDKLELLVAHGKGNRTRLLPVGSHLGGVLRDYLASVRPQFPMDKSPSLFLNRQGGRLEKWMVQTIVCQYAKQLGLSQTNPHSIRHAFATHLLQNGAPIVGVQRLLGHVTLLMTQRYTHLLQIDLAKELARTHPRAKRIRRKDSPDAAK